MKRILVPTDFSACANVAVDFAVQSAKIAPLEIVIVHSIELNSSLYSDYLGVNKSYNLALINEVRDKLNNLKRVILETQGVSLEICVYKDPLQEGILQAVTDENIDLVVMGTTGASGLKEILWGSKTAGIMGKCVVPVLAIPFDYTWKKPAKILMAVNGVDEVETAVNFVKRMGSLLGAQVDIVVFTDEEMDISRAPIAQSHNLPTSESPVKEKYSPQYMRIVHPFGHSFEDTLNNYILQNEVDMLAMVTHHRKFFNFLFDPSKTKHMSYHTTVPLLAIPAN